MFICVFPNIFPLPPHGGPGSGLWCCCGCPAHVSPAMSCTTRVAEHSLISPLFCGGMFPCVGEGKDSLTSSFALTRVVFIFLECQNLPAGKLTFCKFSLTHENLPGSEPVSPALAGRVTTGPPKKPQMKYFLTSRYSGDFSQSPENISKMILTSLQLGILAHIITWAPSADPVEEGRITDSSVLAGRIPWTEEPVGLSSVGSQRVGHDRSD